MSIDLMGRSLPLQPATSMRCLLVITRSELGGAQSHVLELLRGLHVRHRLMLVSGDEGWLVNQALQLKVECVIIPELVHPIRPLLDLAAFSSLRALIAGWKPDVVHAHSTKAGVIARLAAASLGVPSLFTAHGWAFQPSYGWMRRQVALLLERIAASLSRGPILCVSHFDRDLAISHHFPTAQIRVVHNGIPDLEEARQNGSRDPHRVVMVARFAAPKDHETLVRAIALVPQVQVELIGEGPDQERIRRLIAQLGLTDRCWLSGAVEDVPQRLTRAGIFVLSSRTEGLPVCIIEAMRAGLPVIASAVGGIVELIEHGVDGFLVPPGDPAALAVAVRTLAQDPALSRTMGRSGRQRFLEHFRQTTMVAAVEQAWSDAVENGNVAMMTGRRVSVHRSPRDRSTRQWDLGDHG